MTFVPHKTMSRKNRPRSKLVDVRGLQQLMELKKQNVALTFPDELWGTLFTFLPLQNVLLYYGSPVARDVISKRITSRLKALCRVTPSLEVAMMAVNAVNKVEPSAIISGSVILRVIFDSGGFWQETPGMLGPSEFKISSKDPWVEGDVDLFCTSNSKSAVDGIITSRLKLSDYNPMYGIGSDCCYFTSNNIDLPWDSLNRIVTEDLDGVVPAFDLTCCMNSFDGKTLVIHHPQFLARGLFTLLNYGRNSTSRTRKYAYRGFKFVDYDYGKWAGVPSGPIDLLFLESVVKSQVNNTQKWVLLPKQE